MAIFQYFLMAFTYVWNKVFGIKQIPCKQYYGQRETYENKPWRKSKKVA